jgi:hypothetical protein
MARVGCCSGISGFRCRQLILVKGTDYYQPRCLAKMSLVSVTCLSDARRQANGFETLMKSNSMRFAMRPLVAYNTLHEWASDCGMRIELLIQCENPMP